MSSNKDNPTTYTTPAIESEVGKKVLLGDPRLDSLMTSVVALGSELWTTKRRMHVMESLLAAKGVGEKEIEQYTPTAEETLKWNTERDRFIAAVYGHNADQGKSGS